MGRVEHAKIKKRKISFKLFDWKYSKRPIIGSYLCRNNWIMILIAKLSLFVEEMKYNQYISHFLPVFESIIRRKTRQKIKIYSWKMI